MQGGLAWFSDRRGLTGGSEEHGLERVDVGAKCSLATPGAGRRAPRVKPGGIRQGVFDAVREGSG